MGLPINTGGKDGTSATARNIEALVNSKSRAGDLVILGGDFNADENSGTVRNLREAGFTVHVTHWVDHIMTFGTGLGQAQSTETISGTGSGHNGLKVVWSRQ